MPVVEYGALPEILMRSGVTGTWIAGHAQGAASVGVLRNWVDPDIAIPRHFHEYEEVVLVEQGEMWVEVDGVRHRGEPGRAIIIPARAIHAWGTFKEKAQVLFVWPAAAPFAACKSTYIEGKPPTVS